MIKIFDNVTRSKLLEDGGVFVLSFDIKGCAGLTLSIAPVEAQSVGSELTKVIEGTGEVTPITLFVHPDSLNHLEGARITRTEKNGKIIYIYTSNQVKNRCGCGKSFGFSEKKVVSKHSKLTEKLQNIKSQLKKPSPEEANPIPSHIIIDLGEEPEKIITLDKIGQQCEYYLILQNRSSIKRSIVSFGDHQDIKLYTLVIETASDDISKHNIEIIADISGSSTHLTSKSLTLSSRSGYTRVLSGIRVLSGSDQNAHISQRSILLSEATSIAQIPLLDVHTPGSHAEHSATIESISREETFYLETRGISPQDAQKIKLRSYIRTIMSSFIITDDKLEHIIEEVLHQKQEKPKNLP